MWYFAYGSNMNSDRLKERIGYIPIMDSGIMKGFRLAFNKLASNGREGYANVIECKGEFVEGIVYQVNAVDLDKLDKYEGVPTHYYRTRLPVATEKCGIVDADVYIAKDTMVREGLKPTREYLAHLLVGREFLSEEYYTRLKSVETLD